MLVLIAEGPSTYPVSKVIQVASQLKKSGVQLVTIGVGKTILSIGKNFRDELHSIASSPEHVFFTGRDDLLGLVDKLDGKLCSNISSSGNDLDLPRFRGSFYAYRLVHFFVL